MNTRDVNVQLKKHHYPADERAGFNFGKSVVVLVEALGINQDEFLRGLLKPLQLRLEQLEDLDAAAKANG